MNPSSQTTPELEAMRAGIAYRFPVQIRNFRVTLRPVTIGEHMQINNEIVQELLEVPDNMRHAINENYLLAKKMLKMASKADIDGKEGPLQDYLLDKMTIDELLYAYDEYLQGVAKVNPKIEKMK